MKCKHICLLLLQLFLLHSTIITNGLCAASSSSSSSSSSGGSRYSQAVNSEHHQHHHTHHQQQQQQQQHNAYTTSTSPALTPAATTKQQQQQQPHATPTTAGSGQHHLLEKRSSYNLLSEAMSQAVSNEFNALGSGSAEGACHADDLDCYSGNIQDRLGMEAIRTLHRQLDDDDNGNIDLSESDDFLREELKYDSGYEKRQKAFHFNDDMHISVKELWEAWLRSEVHNWTIEQTTDWLAQSVQLPQYVELFRQHKVTGAALPRLAVNNMHYVSNVLGIKDPIHKQKISLKAMDVVLFGPPRETGTRWKDYILVTLVLSVIIGCWYGYQLNKNSKRHLRRMAQDLEGLQRAEQSLQEMQKELERARMEQENVATEKMNLERRLKEVPTLSTSNSDLEVQQLKKEIEILRSELSRAEIELVDNCWAPPPQLQTWLQYTYELETKNHQKKRVSAEKQLQSAREACEKLRKKRSSLVGAFVSTHGKSIDDVDRSIVEARNALGEVTNELQERMHRWKQIEQCLGFNIVNNNGLSYLESILYGRNGGSGAGSSGSTKGSRARIANSTDDLDDDSVQGLLDSYTRSSSGGVAGAIGSNSIGNLMSGTASAAPHEDTSGSEDGNDNQSVTFYLGSMPSQTAAERTNAQQARCVPSLTIMDASSSDAVAQSNSGGGSGQHAASAPILNTSLSATSVKSNHMPLASSTNDSYFVDNFVDRTDGGAGGGGRQSPSLSTERLISVPPRVKKQTALALSTTTPTLSNAMAPTAGLNVVGRAPLPPPRKANPSSMLRSQSSDLMLPTNAAASTESTSSSHVLPTPTPTSRFGFEALALMIGRSKKTIVKQHSTASQQSTSSTSSSAHSAPPTANVMNKQQSPTTVQQQQARIKYSPARWTMQEQQPQQQQSMHNLHNNNNNNNAPAMPTAPTAAQTPALILPSSRTFSEYSDLTSMLSVALETPAAKCWPSVVTDDNSSITSSTCTTPTEAAALKKRKRRLRFPFGGSSSSSTRNTSNDSEKSKVT